MELVRGIPINEFCDQKRFSVRQRLELFIQVCQAVQHAHQKGVIHRDLKPTNVLVTMADTVPVPKIIDFGIAKALGQSLTDHTLHTGFAQLVGTPLYMSPEQAELNQLGVDTRSDVYSLGVTLYELLTGTTPFDKDRLKSAGFDEMRRIIREEEPETVSQRLARTPRLGSAQTPLPPGEGGRRPGEGTSAFALTSKSRVPPGCRNPHLSELDWIVSKSLEKDRSRRYESPSALAADLQRYLNDEPVLACPPSTAYRVRKFARKHRVALSTALLVASSLLIGLVLSTWQAVRATTAEAEAQLQRIEAQEERDDAQSQRDQVKSLNDQLRRTLYASNVNLAKHAWDDAAVPRVRELLEQLRPKRGEVDLRGFEWYCLHRLCHSDLLTIEWPIIRLASVAYSPDGKRVVAGATSQWDEAKNAFVGGALKVWDAQTGRELISIPGDGGDVVFSPDGKVLAIAASDGVKVRDSETGAELRSLKHGYAWSVAFSPDGKRLASASDDETVRVWDSDTGQELFAIKDGGWDVTFSPDGKKLASAGDDDTVRVWDSDTGRELLAIKDGGWDATFSPDGKRLASATGNATNNVVKVWNSQTGREIVTLRGHSGQVNSVAYSPDGKQIATAAADRTVRIWNSQTGQELVTFKGHASMAMHAVFSPDGSKLASLGSNDGIKVWDVNSQPGSPTIRGLSGTVTSIGFTRDGTRLAAGIRTENSVRLMVLNAASGQELFSIEGLSGAVRSVQFSPDGSGLAAAYDKIAKVWDSQTSRELLELPGHANTVISVAYSPDGKRLATTDVNSSDGNHTTKLWDAQSGRELFSLTGLRGIVAFSPDGTRLSGPLRNATKVWVAQTGDELRSFPISGYLGNGGVE